MRKRDHQQLRMFSGVSLKARIPKDHPLRLLKDTSAVFENHAVEDSKRLNDSLRLLRPPIILSESGTWPRLHLKPDLQAPGGPTNLYFKILWDTESLPFELGAHKRIAVKIVEDCEIESLKFLVLEV